MDANDERYARAIGELRERIPELAEQLEREVRYGRSVSEKGLREEGRYKERAERLAETKLTPLGKTDVAVIPYSDDERVDLVRQALLNLAETMYASRHSVLSELRESGLRTTISFADAEDQDTSVLDLEVETERARATLWEVRAFLDDSSAGDRGDL